MCLFASVHPYPAKSSIAVNEGSQGNAMQIVEDKTAQCMCEGKESKPY